MTLHICVLKLYVNFTVQG